MSHAKEEAREFVGKVKALGFRAFLAKDGTYGFVTDAEGSRVLSFSFGWDQSLGGNYGPPSRESGTGWRMDESPYHLRTKEDVKRALYAEAPSWCRRAGSQRCGQCGQPRPSDHNGGWKHYTTLEQHLAMYGSSSGYQEV